MRVPNQECGSEGHQFGPQKLIQFVQSYPNQCEGWILGGNNDKIWLSKNKNEIISDIKSPCQKVLFSTGILNIPKINMKLEVWDRINELL